MNPCDLLASRKFGATRYSIFADPVADMRTVLASFGLQPEPKLLLEVDQALAESILSQVLWKSLVHSGVENMPREDARRLAKDVLAEHTTEGCRFYSNTTDAEVRTWSSLTDSTCECGIIVSSPLGLHFCILV